jgi:predicted enzyme related to lactoylglutathione lyase
MSIFHFEGRLWHAVLMLTVFWATAAGAAAPELPPLNDPPSSTRLPGKFVWVDLLTPDVERAEVFYSKLFGWTFRKVGSGDSAYTLALLDEEPIAGILRVPVKTGERKQARWIGYISVPDVSQAQRQVLGQGGKVLVSPRSVPRRGDLAVFADREGVIFGVMSSSSGDAEDFLTETADWIWAQFLSRHGDAAAKFYASHGGSTVLEAPKPDGTKRWFLVSQGYTRASIIELPPNRADAGPGWLGYVRVADAASTVALARELGGRILVPPRPDLFDGKVALIADPDGGVLGVLKWDPVEGGK